MATITTPFLSTAKSFLSPYSSSHLTPAAAVISVNGGRNRARFRIVCSASDKHEAVLVLSKRGFLAGSIVWSVSLNASGAILEADDDEELLEKVKKDRKKRLERQGVITSETGYLQDVVYNLSKVGQAIDNNDFSTATYVLGRNTDTNWVQNANTAFTKLTATPEENTQVQTFNSSLASLISSVLKRDTESSKMAFVESASAFQKWTKLTGLYGQLKGL